MINEPWLYILLWYFGIVCLSACPVILLCYNKTNTASLSSLSLCVCVCVSVCVSAHVSVYVSDVFVGSCLSIVCLDTAVSYCFHGLAKSTTGIFRPRKRSTVLHCNLLRLWIHIEQFNFMARERIIAEQALLCSIGHICVSAIVLMDWVMAVLSVLDIKLNGHVTPALDHGVNPIQMCLPCTNWPLTWFSCHLCDCTATA